MRLEGKYPDAFNAAISYMPNCWDRRPNGLVRKTLIDEMKTFMLQTLESMNQTISKAIGNEDLIKIIDEFSQKFESKINEDTK